MMYKILDLHERINFKSWRKGYGPKFLNSDKEDNEEFEFWNGVKKCAQFCDTPSDERNRRAHFLRRLHC